jgi:hypothetical protein
MMKLKTQLNTKNQTQKTKETTNKNTINGPIFLSILSNQAAIAMLLIRWRGRQRRHWATVSSTVIAENIIDDIGHSHHFAIGDHHAAQRICVRPPPRGRQTRSGPSAALTGR